MRKRLSSKLLAMVLTLAICATTVLGCLMTVSAAEPCYSFGAATFPSADDLTEASIDVTFTHSNLPNGIVAGGFEWTEVDADSADYLVLKEIKAKTTGVNVAVEKEENYVLFDSADAHNPVVLTLVFGFSNGSANRDETYKVRLDKVELAFNHSEYVFEEEGNSICEIAAACQHVLTVAGAPIATDNANGYAVYENAICSLCGETFGYQLVPTYGTSEGDNEDYVNPTIKWDGTKVAPTEGTGTETDPYIISEVSHLAYITEAGPDYTHGKFFKVKDGIKNIVLQKAADADTLINIKSAEEAKTYLSSLSGRSRWNTGKYDAASAFCGTFDGNDATIYGLSADTSFNISLFGSIGVNAEFKNLNIKNSFIQSGWYAATLAHVTLGYTLADGTAVSKGTVKVHDCTFAQNYINPQSGVDPGTTGNQCIAVILGQTGSSASGSGLSLRNILTYDNITFYEKTQTNVSPLIGSLYSPPGPDAETETEYCEVMDCIFLDVTSHLMAAINNNLISYKNAQSIYSDSYWIQDWINSGWYNAQGLDAKTVSKAEMLGTSALTAAPNLTWGKDWILGAAGELPSRAGLNYVSDTIYWDGANTKTAPTVGGGTKDNPYIISTVAELAYISGQGRDNYAITDGKFYKIADGIKNIVMQPYAYGAEIMALENAAQVKSYFEKNGANLKQWLHYGWEGSTFCGNIDFGGATVYGIYQVSTDNAGLFSNIDAGAVISNLAIRNSYMKSESSGKNYQVAAIASVTNGETYGKAVKGIIWLKNIVVANNYMYDNVVSTTNNERAGVIIGAASDAVYVDNALVYGNDATYGDGAIMPIMSTASNSADEDAAVPEGLVISYGGTHGTTGKLLHNNMVRNSIILGAYPVDYSQNKGSRFNDPNCFQNVYTDADITSKTFSDGKTVLGAKDAQITVIDASDAKGSGAKTAMPGLAWGTDWYCGTISGYPVQAPFATLSASEYSTPEVELVASNVGYNEDGSFNFNLHYVPKVEGLVPTLYIGTVDGSKFMKIDTPVESCYKDQLGDNALMYTIPNLSARDIDLVWLPTLVTEGSAVLEWGNSQPIAIADNAKAILEGDYAAADKAVAAAIINYGAKSDAVSSETYNPGTIDLLEFGDYLLEAGSTSKWYDTKLADNGETGADWDNAIIIDSAEEFVYLAKASGDDTAGKYYKVADGIAGFDLSNGKLDYTKGLAANIDTIKAGGKNHAGNTPGFQGHFDGNGITVYGAWTNHQTISGYAGLFSCAKNDVTIKNVHVKLASFTAKTAVGGIIGYYAADKMSQVNIENCSVTESHLETTEYTSTSGGLGAIVGYAGSAPSYKDENGKTVYVNVDFNVNNCFVNLDKNYFISAAEDGAYQNGEYAAYGGVVSMSGTNDVMVSNCIVIGVKPYPVTDNNAWNGIQHTGHANNFSNVYTDQLVSNAIYVGGTTGNTQNLTTVMTQLTTAQLTGLKANNNMPALDWNNVWTTTNGYPTFINNKYEAPASGIVLTWDGSVATGIATGSGTKADPYIINSASELAWLVQQNEKATLDKYFKVADGVSAIVLQSADKASDIMALSSAAETKAYFENGSFTQWKTTGWEQAGFCGNFDGNGATIYGMYAKSTNNAALFCTVDAGATIKNIGVKNAYLTSSASNYQVAAIVGVGSDSSHSAKNRGVFAITGCTVANCYLRNSATGHDRSGVILGAVSEDSYYMENCLVYGNDAYYGANYENKMSLISTSVGNNMSPDTAKLPEGITPTTNGNLYNNEIRNSVILGCDVMNLKGARGWRRNDAGCYTNVYSDMSALVNGVITYSDGTFTYTENDIKKITQQDAFGANAEVVMPNLAWGDVWFTGAAGDAPGFKPAGDMPSSAQTAFDTMILSNYDTVGEGTVYNASNNMVFGMYNASLNIKANPYMVFTFAFAGEYKENRDKIKIRFTYTKDGATVVGEEIAVPAFDGSDVVNVNGWTHKASQNAGRYHTYRATNIPVEALASGIKVEASYKGGAWLDFGSYSVEGFALMAENANKIEPCDYYASRYDAAKALLFYVKMIQARYGK